MSDGWAPKYRGDSRPWLLGPPGVIPEKQSLSHADFGQPVVLRPPAKGRQAELLEAFLWQEAAEEAAEMLKRPHPVQEYNTEYRRHYHKDVAHKPLPLQKLEQHPLYCDSALSYWRDMQSRHAFHRSSAFSRPLSEEMDLPMR